MPNFNPSTIDSKETINSYGCEIDPRLDTAKDVGNKEIKDYVKNKYEYQKGKGWQLKESKLKAIVSESIKKVLSNLDK